MQPLVRLLRQAVRCLFLLLQMLLQPPLSAILTWWYPATTVSPVTDEVLLLSAVEIADRIRTKKVTAVEVMQRFIQRVKAVNPVVNAVVVDMFSEALEAAGNVDRQLAEDDSSVKDLPLLGVPLSVKEAFQVKGMPSCSGLWTRRNNKAPSTAPVVRHLEAAGAIPFILTNTSELCMWYESANNVYGRTNNAYSTSHIVGGSSGGEGCILSTGASVMGVGSDIGGSIRMPAFFNGVYGHKPSRGVVDNSGQHPPATGSQVDLLVTGPLCRYAADLLPLMQIMSGDASQLNLKKKVDLKELRFFSMENDGGGLLQSNVNQELVAAQKKAVAYLEHTLGVRVTTLNLRRMKYSMEMWSARMTSSDGKTFSEFMAGEKGSVNGFYELFLWLIGRSHHTLPAIMLAVIECFTPLLEGSNAQFLKMLTEFEKEMRELLDDGGILLYPSHPCSAQLHNQPLSTPTNFSYTAIFNALGLPVTQCPLGLNKSGLPVGVQIVGGMYEDRNTIAVAQALEAGPGGWVTPGQM
ncbi:fatty-acid amide hydrolase 2-like [Haliotis cracherodii]|uniref:fatty-acid amide hydrolase 2-like n=1 Tax=Haliotis cracherodii TaxID=6455 RepID=UPI0039E9541A